MTDTLRRIPLCIISLASTLAFAAGPSLYENPPGSFRNETLEVYLDRADREKEAEAWLRFADMGKEASLAEWEDLALLAVGDGGREKDRSSFMEGIGTETRGRYADWLVARFIEGSFAGPLRPLRDAIDGQNGTLLYERGSGGGILLDSNGDPILRKLSGLEEDAGTWEEAVAAAIDGSVAAWRSSFEGSFPELLALVPEAERPALEARRTGYADGYGAAYRQELAALALQEEQRFVALRSFDSYSQRKKSEEETAGAIADRLVAATQGSTDEAIRRLRDSLAIGAGAGAGEAKVDASDWQASFERILETGLATWGRAEKELLAERVEWESRAGKDYSDGEKAWASAYEKLRESESAWQSELRTILQAGQEAWANKETELETSIARARTELDQEIQTRREASSEDVSSLVEVYAQSASMVATAKESAAYWLEKLGVAVADGASERLALDEYSKEHAGAEADPDYQQASYWAGVIGTYTDFSRGAKSALESAFSRVISDDGAAKTLLGVSGSSADLTSLCLDEYQVEFLKAEALAAYWDGQVDIAEKVYAYAEDSSSDRPTAAQTEAACSRALDAYKTAKGGYDAALAFLEQKGKELGSAKDALASARSGLAVARAELERTQKDYQTLQAFFASKDTKDFFTKELTTGYEALLAELDPANESGVSLAMADYLTAARKYGYDDRIQIDNRELEALVRGDEAHGIDSLDTLRAAVASAVVPKDEAELGSFAVAPTGATSAIYGQYLAAVSRYDEAAREGRKADASFYFAVCASIASQYRSSLVSKLDDREAAIRLLSSATAGLWYEAETGAAGLDANAVVAAANEAAALAAGNYLLARACLESKAYGRVDAIRTTGIFDATKNEDMLGFAASPAVAGAATKQAALEALSVFLAAGHLDLAASHDALCDFIAGFDGGEGTKAFLRSFVEGASEFYSILGADGSVAVDLPGGCLLEARRNRDRALMLPGVIARYAPESLAFAESREASGRAELRSALASSGLLASGPELAFVDATVAWDSAKALTPAAREDYLVSLYTSARRAEPKLAPYQAERLEAYLSGLAAYFGSREALGNAGPAAAGSAAEVAASLGSSKTRLDGLSSLELRAAAMDGRFACLAGVYAWARDDPSAGAEEVAAARNCLVEAAAVLTARRAIGASADPAVSLADEATWQGAFAAAFAGAAGQLSELAPRVIERAKELFDVEQCLQGAKAAESDEEKKAFAYALWKQPDLCVDASSLRLSAENGLLVDLWKFVTDDSAKGLGGSYSGRADELAKTDAFLADLGVGTQTAECILVFGLLERIKNGLEPKESIFLEALCPGLGAAAKAAKRYAASGGEVFERKLAIDLAGKCGGERGGDCYGLLLSLSGIQPHGVIDSLWLGAAEPDSLGRALSGLSGTTFDEAALVFFCKQWMASGEEIDFGGLSAAGKAELQSFKPTDLFLTADFGLDGSASSYLDRLQRALVGSDLSCDGGLAEEALRLLVKDLDVAAAEEGDLYAETAARYEIRRARDGCLASGCGDYRGYLIPAKYFAAAQGGTVPLSTEVEEASGHDATGDVHHAKEGAAFDLALEAGGNLDAAGRAFALSLEIANASELDRRDAEYASYCREMGRFIEGPSPVSTWSSADDTYTAIGSRNACLDALNTLSSEQGKIAAIESEIVRLGKGLDAYSADDGERQRRLIASTNAVEEAKNRYAGTLDSVKAASDAYAAKLGDYENVYDESLGSYDLLGAARHEAEIKEAIGDYARSAYLEPDDPGSASYLQPAEALSYAQGKRDKAQNLVAALKGLYDETATGRGTETPEISAYRDSYRRYLELAKLQNQLDRACAAQQLATDEAKRRCDEAEAKRFSAAPVLEAVYPQKNLSATTADDTLGAYLLEYDAVTGISLNYDSNYIVTQAGPSTYEGLKAYFESGDEPANESLTYKSQVADFCSFLSDRSGEADDLMRRWGLAYEYLENRLFTANCDADAAEESKTALQRILEDGGVVSNNPAAALERDGLFSMVATTTAKTDLGDYRGRLDAACAAAYSAVTGDAVQNRMFQFLVAARLTGCCQGWDFLDRASTLALAEETRAVLTDAEKSHRNESTKLYALSAVATQAAIACACIPFVGWLAAIPYTVTAGVFLAAGVTEADKSDKAGEARGRLGNYLDPAAGLCSTFKAGETALVADMKGIDSARADWAQCASALALLRSSTPGRPLGVDDALASLDAAIRKLGGEASSGLSAEQARYVRDAFVSGNVKSSDALSALSACVAAARDEKDSCGAALKAAVADDKTAQAADERRYRELAASYLDGQASVGAEEVAAAAKAAYGSSNAGSSAYVDLAYQSELASALGRLGTGDPGANAGYEKDKAEVLAEYASVVGELFASRMAAFESLRENEWRLMELDLKAKEARWSSMIEATVGLSAQAWNGASAKLDASYRTWRGAFEKDYRDKDELWAESYAGFANRKAAWVDDLALKAGQAGSDEILAAAGVSAELMSRDSSFVPDANAVRTDPDGLVNDLLGGTGLRAELSSLNRRNAGIASLAYDLQRGFGVGLGDGSGSAALVARFQASQDGELGDRAALIVADQARESIAKARKGLGDLVSKANESFESNMDEMYLGSAFLKTGGAYVRDAIVGAISGGALKERQRVETYRPFALPDFSARASLERKDLEGLKADGVRARLNAAIKELDGERQDIFGTDDMSASDRAALKRTLTINGAAAGDPRDATDSAPRTEIQTEGSGEFGRHIGFAPIFQKSPAADDLGRPEDMVVAAGEGEAGRLVMYYAYFQVKEGKGIAEYSKPSWDRKIWDDRGSWIKSPTPAEVVDAGVSIAAMAVGAGPWVSMAINLADDASFGMMDVAGGYRKADEALFDFGKKALASVTTTAIGGAFSGGGAFGSYGGFAGSIDGSTIGGAIEKTLLKGAELFSSTLAAGAIAGITYSGTEGFGYDSGIFVDRAFGSSALAGYASGMAGTLVTGTLDSQLYGFVGGTYAGGLRLDSLAGSLAGQGLGYVLTGSSTLNLANLSMLGLNDARGSPLSMGLLELHLGGSGLSMGLGSGGADVSLGTLAGAAGGLSAWGKNLRLAASNEEEARKYVVAMRTLSSTGHASDARLYEDLLSGNASIQEDSTGGAERDYAAMTVAENGKRTIRLGSGASALGSALSMGVLLSHEGYRNGIYDGEQEQVDETLRAIQGHIGTAALIEATYGKGSLGGRMSEELAAIGSGDTSRMAAVFGEYSTAADYWRLQRDGKLLFDKRASLTIENADGTTREIGYKQLGLSSDAQVETALAILLGISNADARTVMTDQMNLTHSSVADPKKWEWLNEKRNVAPGGYTYVTSIGELNLGKGMNLDDLSGKIKVKMRKDLFEAAYRDEIAKVIQNPNEISKYISAKAKWSLGGSQTYDALSERFVRAFASEYTRLPLETRKSILSGSDGQYSMNAALAAALQDPASYRPYAATADGNTYCNVFVYEQLMKTDPRVAIELFPDGLISARKMQEYLNTSAFSTSTSIDDVMAKANSGGLVLASLAQDTQFHVGFVVPDSWEFFNPLGITGLPKGNGKQYVIAGNTYVGKNFSWPPIADAGSDKAIGITTPGFSFGRNYTDFVQYYYIGWKK